MSTEEHRKRFIEVARGLREEMARDATPTQPELLSAETIYRELLQRIQGEPPPPVYQWPERT